MRKDASKATFPARGALAEVLVVLRAGMLSCRTEPVGVGHGSEPAHRVIALGQSDDDVGKDLVLPLVCAEPLVGFVGDGERLCFHVYK